MVEIFDVVASFLVKCFDRGIQGLAASLTDSKEFMLHKIREEFLLA